MLEAINVEACSSQAIPSATLHPGYELATKIRSQTVPKVQDFRSQILAWV